MQDGEWYEPPRWVRFLLDWPLPGTEWLITRWIRRQPSATVLGFRRYIKARQAAEALLNPRRRREDNR